MFIAVYLDAIPASGSIAADWGGLMSASSKIRIGAAWVGIALLIFGGWCVIIVTYLVLYNTLESVAVPVSFGYAKDFSVEQWESGYFHAKGTYKNTSAVDDGDEMVPQTDDITCTTQSNTCTIAIASVFDNFLDLDVTIYDVATWSDKQIIFSDDSSICASSSFIIDRVSQSFNLVVRKKAKIPEYAQKSSLHPCDNLKDKDIALVDGFPVYWRLRERFEQRNGLYFHALLFVMNAAYFGCLLLWWRRWRYRRAALVTQAS